MALAHQRVETALFGAHRYLTKQMTLCGTCNLHSYLTIIVILSLEPRTSATISRPGLKILGICCLLTNSDPRMTMGSFYLHLIASCLSFISVIGGVFARVGLGFSGTGKGANGFRAVPMTKQTRLLLDIRGKFGFDSGALGLSRYSIIWLRLWISRKASRDISTLIAKPSRTPSLFD